MRTNTKIGIAWTVIFVLVIGTAWGLWSLFWAWVGPFVSQVWR